jgi:hypothetical protein
MSPVAHEVGRGRADEEDRRQEGNDERADPFGRPDSPHGPFLKH